MISLTIENLTKRFGATVALDRVSLRIHEGELFFLLGASGCGKTTLLRSIAGFLIPEEGRILFAGDDVTRLPPHLRNTGMMFQSYALWPHLTVAKNVAFGLEERRVAGPEIARRVQEALESVRMGSYGERKIHQLSGGQQQRVALARALIIRPRCLLLDEPLSNLDARLRLEMRTEIRRICKESGLTAIYVTHDQKEALSVADRMAILDSGRICQVGNPAEVYRQPDSRLVADFMGETNFLDGRIVDLSADQWSVETSLGSFHASRAASAWQPHIGEACTLSIRPESWKLGAKAESQNSFPGRILSRVFLGEIAQYQFAAGAQILKIYELNPRAADLRGDRELFATVAPEDVVALPA